MSCVRARAQEVAILEYQNKQKDESASLSEQVQAAYDKGYDKAVETITRFQNLRPAGAPPSAMSSASFSAKSRTVSWVESGCDVSSISVSLLTV